MAITVFSDVSQKMDDAVLTVLGAKTTALISVISPVIMSAFLLYVLLVVMSYMKNGTDPAEMGVDMIQRLIGWSVIIALSMNIGTYTDTIVPMVNGIPQEITNAILGNSGDNINNALDSLATQYVDKINEMFEGLDFTDIGGFLIAFLISLILAVLGLPFLIIAGGYILLAKIAIGVLLVLAPAFIVMALFPTTRNFASLWVGQVVNFGLLILIMNILASIQIEFLTGMTTSAELDMSTGFMIGITSGLFLVVLLKAPEIASALSGGMVLNGYTQAGKSVTGGVNAASGVAGRGLTGGKSVVGAIKGRLGGGNAIKAESAGK